MEHREGKRIILLGLDEGLLWQLTRSLASIADDLEYYCAASPSEAIDLLRDKPFDLLVVDSAETGLTVLEGLEAGPASSPGPARPRLLVLTGGSLKDVPRELMLPDDTLFLERPFNPKDFPFFVSQALQESVPSSPPWSAHPGHEEAAGGAGAGQGEGESKEGTDFYRSFSEGFACLARKDLQGAMEHWLHALSLRPENKVVRANLARLEKMIGQRKS
jgi:hypothetical protein